MLTAATPINNPAHQSVPLYSILDNMDDGVVLVNTDLRITYINRVAVNITKQVYGFTYTTGDHIVERLPEYRQGAVYKILNQVLSGENITYEVEIPQPDGNSEWLRCADKPLYSEDGSLSGLSVFMTSITAQKLLANAEAKQKELREQSRQNRQLFEEFMQNAPLLGWITDAAGTIHYLNPSFIVQHKLVQSDCGKNIYDLLPTQLALDWHFQNLRVLKDDKLIESTERLEKPGGKESIYKVYRFPVTHSGVTMVAAWAVDITAHAGLELQLKRHLEQYYYIIEATSDAIYDWKPADDQVFRGSNYATLFGYIDHVVTSSESYAAIHEDDRNRIQKSHAHALTDPQAQGWALEYRFRCADGSYKYVLDRATIIRADTNPVRILGALQDVTEQKQLHKKLLQQETDKKREIVRSVIETQEKERRKLSVELHDNVNQMLSSCKLLLEVACDGGSNALDLTRKSHAGISKVITEIRKISHDLNPSTLDDVGLTDAITEMVSLINATGKIYIEHKLSGLSGKSTLGKEDSIAVYRIIQEQISNILKHSKATRASIHVVKQNLGIKVHIEDNGVGFEVEKSKKGLGLKNIQNRVDYYAGSISLVSKKNEGTSLDVLLRL